MARRRPLTSHRFISKDQLGVLAVQTPARPSPTTGGCRFPPVKENDPR
jgi:hypothetical protein